MTPLHLSNHCLETFQALIDLGANIGLCDSQGNLPLHHFVQLEHADKVEAALKIMLDKGINIDQENGSGRTPEELANILLKDQCNLSPPGPIARIAEAFKAIKNPPIDKHPTARNISLRNMIQQGEIEKIRVLLTALDEEGEKIDQQDIFGSDALNMAVLNGDTEIFNLILNAYQKSNARLNHTDNQGNTALHQAASGDNLVIAECLIDAYKEAGIPINSKNEDEATPLYYVENNPKMIALFNEKKTEEFPIN